MFVLTGKAIINGHHVARSITRRLLTEDSKDSKDFSFTEIWAGAWCFITSTASRFYCAEDLFRMETISVVVGFYEEKVVSIQSKVFEANGECCNWCQRWHFIHLYLGEKNPSFFSFRSPVYVSFRPQKTEEISRSLMCRGYLWLDDRRCQEDYDSTKVAARSWRWNIRWIFISSHGLRK